MCNSSSTRWCLLLFSAVLVSACATAPEVKEKPAPPAVEPPAPDPVEQARERRRAREALLERLLEQADEALADDRLTIPVHDNAYDRYNAVLLVDQNNEAARAGLQSILLRYARLIREQLRRGRVDGARQLLARARDHFEGNPLLADLQRDIDQVENQARERVRELAEQGSDSDVIRLPASELSRRSGDMVKLLSRVAERVRESGESVLIVARSDAEGRWIYKQMNDAVPDYRIRGNIRVAAEPRLQLLPPL